MRPQYRNWIDATIATRFGGDGRRTLGQCERVASDMADAFDELRLVKGHAYCPQPWGKRGHWWLVDGEDVVDPTAGQFTAGVFRYEEYLPGDAVRLGTCLHCAAGLWGDPASDLWPMFCGATCRSAYATYLGS